MCGICGIVYQDPARPVPRGRIDAMNAALGHRGPDDAAVWTGRGAALAARRLAIRDIAHGRQPMTNEDGRWVVAFNGELYNDRDLRAALAHCGHAFKTRCDTETVLRAFQAWGDAALDRFNGMYAIAVYDTEERRLVLARDRLGIKPLHYAALANGIAFSSELDSLLVSGHIDQTIDHAALDEYFTRLYIPAPATIYKQVRKLLPGEVLVAERGVVSLRRYWRPEFVMDGSWTEESAAEAYRALLRDAVKAQRVGDLPVGAFLSGGLDSSSVVALMSESGGAIRTFSIGFDDSAANELPFARAVAQRFGTIHHEAVMRPDLAKLACELTLNFGEPFADSSAIPTWMVSKHARDHVTVALSGDGGDELFAGYAWTHMNHRVSRYRALPRAVRRAVNYSLRIAPASPRIQKLRRFSSDSFLSHEQGFQRRQTCFTDAEKHALYAPEFRALIPDRIDPVPASDPISPDDWMLREDLGGYLPDDVLTKVDRMSMANGLEVRVPILDHRIVEFACTVPFHLKFRHGVSKRLVKRAFADILPRETCIQRKQGFAIPIHRWFREDLAGYFRETVLQSNENLSPFLNSDGISAMFRSHAEGRANYGHHLWAVLMLEHWLQYRAAATCRAASSLRADRLSPPLAV